MKEIGESFKEKREEIGITLEEVSKDLGIKEVLLENLEEGNAKVFKDILEIKDTIESYSKYLGLSYEDMIDEFNEYLFDYTSKISLEDIKKAKKKAERNQAKKDKRIASPYTIERRRKIDYKLVLILFLIFLALLISIFTIKQVIDVNKSREPVDNVIR